MKVEITRKKLLEEGEACVAILRHSPRFEGRNLSARVLSRGDLNFCVRCSTLRVAALGFEQVQNNLVTGPLTFQRRFLQQDYST